MENATPEEGWLRTSQVRMHYLDWGSPGAGQESPRSPVVLALHGLASSCHWFDLVIPDLVDSHRCLALDQRGHGETDQPPTGYDWQTLSTDVIEALDQLGLEKATVVGHSWGAYVALSLAAKYPNRVSALVMIDGGFFDWTRWPEATWDWFKDRLSPRDVSGKRDEYVGRLRQQLAECWSDQLESIVMSMVRVGPDGAVRDILEPSSHAQVLEAMWKEPCSTMFPQVSCPTLIVAAGPRQRGGSSEFAKMRHDMATAAQSAIKGSQVAWIPDTIHDIGYHKQAELAGVLLDFLSRG